MKYNYYSIFILYALLITAPPLGACSSIRLKAKDGSVIYARTMDFTINTSSEIVVFPRNTEFKATLPEGKVGLNWKNKYGFIGINALGLDHAADGINEKGLALGVLYLPNYAEYEKLTDSNAKNSIAQWELGSYLLGTCSNIAEVHKILPTIHVVYSYMKAHPDMPIHYIVHDTLGNSLVIEYVKGNLTTYDNPLGVFTNTPTFDWHLKNINNYLHLFTSPTKTLSLDGMTFFAHGEGNNLFGLPGDFTSPSRFMRLVILTQTALQPANAEEGIYQAINIINNVIVPYGTVKSIVNNKQTYDYTQWVTVYDLANKRMYYRTYENHNYRYIDLNKISFNGNKIKKLPMREKPQYIDNTYKLQ
jgi:choloylglycine hydrolase